MKQIITFLLVLASFSYLSSQTQIGGDIHGEAANDWFGFSVALSDNGERLAVGAVSNNGGGEDAGHARVFELSDGSWVQMGDDIDGEESFNQCGRSLALSADGSRVAVSAHLNNGNGFAAGHVRVYEWTAGNWVQLGADIDGEAFGNWFGQAIDLSADGSRLLAGAVYNLDAGVYAGHARVFEWDGTNWVQLGTDIDGEAAEDEFGWSVSMSADGQRVAVSARGNNGNGTNSGHVRVFEWTAGSWIQMGADIDGEMIGDFSGESIALSADGRRVAIGAMHNDGAAADAGHIRVFEWVSNNWVQIGTDIDGKAADELVGRAIAFSADGNTLASGVWPRFVRLYNWTGGYWAQAGADIIGVNEVQGFGHAISFSANANRLAIGAPFANDGTGYVQVYADFTTSISELDRHRSIQYFPNPTDGVIQVSGVEAGEVIIRNANGQMIRKEALTGQAIDLVYLPDGVYYISVYADQLTVTKQIIKISH